MNLFNGKNYFNDESFNELCKRLEAGEELELYIDCIGHTRNNCEQETYREELENKYKDRLEAKINYGACMYSYTYRLKGDE